MSDDGDNNDDKIIFGEDGGESHGEGEGIEFNKPKSRSTKSANFFCSASIAKNVVMNWS